MTPTRKALEVYGLDAQIIKLSEECGELLSAVSKCRSGRDTADHVAEEMADVLVMMDQMQIAFGITEKTVFDYVEKKLERLEKRLADCD